MPKFYEVDEAQAAISKLVKAKMDNYWDSNLIGNLADYPHIECRDDSDEIVGFFLDDEDLKFLAECVDVHIAEM